MQTNKTIPTNKLDIMVSDNENKTCMLIGAAISGDRCDQERRQDYSNIKTLQ
jgi:hypothetical protein